MNGRVGRAPSAVFDEHLQVALGWTFNDHALLDRALTHRSFCAENGVAESNERLEFLGDSVLGFVVTKFVYNEYPAMAEGELAKLRATVVSTETLAQLGVCAELGAALRLGKGEAASGGRTKPSILADAMEAVFAAVYLDGGLEAATRVIIAALEQPIREQAVGPGGSDFKTRLQELAAQRVDQMPCYQVRHEGPDHSKRFFATVLLRGEVYGDGEGQSKKAAEQAAARVAGQRLQQEAEADSPERSGEVVGLGSTDMSTGGGDAGAA